MSLDVLTEKIRAIEEERLPELKAIMVGGFARLDGKLGPLESRTNALETFRIQLETKDQVRSELSTKQESASDAKRDNLWYPIIAGLALLLGGGLLSHFFHL